MKKVFLIILVTFSIFSSVSFGCEDKMVHNLVSELIKSSSALEVKEKKLFIDTKIFALEVFMISSNEKEGKDNATVLFNALKVYCLYHGISIETR